MKVNFPPRFSLKFSRIISSISSTITLKRLKQRGYESLLEVYTTLNPSICEPLSTRPVRLVVWEVHSVSIWRSRLLDYRLVFCLSVLANHCRCWVSLSLSVSCWSVRLRIFYFQKGRRIFLIQFCLRGKGGSSFASFGLSLDLCSLQMCLHLCVGL